MPSMPSCRPGRALVRFSSAPRRLKRISFTREDFPDPDTPVTAMNVPRGKLTSMWRRLFSAAPRTVSRCPLPARRWVGTGTFFRPAR